MLEEFQEDHQSNVVEVEVKIGEQYVSSFIGSGSNHSYITPKIVDICDFNKLKNIKSWLVQIDIGTKRKVNEVVEKCSLVMDGIFTYANMNLLPLGSYDILIVMDWLE